MCIERAKWSLTATHATVGGTWLPVADGTANAGTRGERRRFLRSTLPGLGWSGKPPGQVDALNHERDESGLLTGPELVVLQLYARGYTVEQLAYMVGTPTIRVRGLLAQAARRLGVLDGNAGGAVAEARRRGLII